MLRVKTLENLILPFFHFPTVSWQPNTLTPQVSRKMAKKNTERKVNVSGKPKHSLDVNRSDGKNNSRTAATVRRLKMYNTRPKRNAKGKILSHEFQSKELPNTRIQPDRRWFGKLKLTFFFFSFKLVPFSC